MVDYSGWTRTNLIERIQQLEGDPKKTAKPQKKKAKPFVFSKYQTRLVALRFAYLGWDYAGLALQKNAVTTVESKVLEALTQVKLIDGSDFTKCEFSRCGRTDRGVSAMNQVISLRLRSKLTAEELLDPANDYKELDYIRMLNHCLPIDIRFHSVCLRLPEGFDARFSCLWRHYKYTFNGQGLDVDKMKEATKLFEGDHDFRNYCKVDPSKQIVNYHRTVYQAHIEEMEEEPGYFTMNLRGSAFLWHQVRCMMAVLFQVGQGHEQPSIVTDLFDIEKYPARPAYRLAHDIPLVLYDCGYSDEVKWGSGPPRNTVMHSEINGLANDNEIKSIITNYMGETVIHNQPEKWNGKVMEILGDGIGDLSARYIPFEKRTRLSTPAEINEKWLQRKARQEAEEQEAKRQKV